METEVDCECAICGQILCAPVTTPCRHTFCRGCLSVWLFEHEQTSCPACRGALDANCTETIDVRVDEAARLSFPDEWEARRDAERASSEELWLAQVPFLLCQDSDWARLVRGLEFESTTSISLAAQQRTKEAMLSLPRRWFLPPSQRSRAHDGNPARLSFLRFNVSAPGMHAHALNLLELRPGHSFLDVGSGCGILTCLAARLVYPGGEAHGIDIRQRAIDFSIRNSKSAIDELRRRATFNAALRLGTSCFQGSIVRACPPSADLVPGKGRGSEDVPAGSLHANAEGVDPESQRVVLQVLADLDQGRFTAVMSHVKSSYVAARGAVTTRCLGTFRNEGSVVLEEVEVVQVTAVAAPVRRETPTEYLLRQDADGALRGHYTCGNGETGVIELVPVDMASTIAALEQGLVFQRGNVFGSQRATPFDDELAARAAVPHHEDSDMGTSGGPWHGRQYDRIHVGANICADRHLEVFKLLKPGGLLVGPMSDRMVVVTRLPRQHSDSRPATEVTDEEFVIRETMQVRYGDLILPEKEADELRESEAPSRSLLLGVRRPGDMIACRACCCPIALAANAAEPVDVAMGEHVRMHGVGSVVMIRDADDAARVETRGQPRLIKELGWARPASCTRCGIFLGLHFCQAPDADILLTPTSTNVVHGPGAPMGSLLMPRAFVVRASGAHLQELQQWCRDHADSWRQLLASTARGDRAESQNLRPGGRKSVMAVQSDRASEIEAAAAEVAEAVTVTASNSVAEPSPPWAPSSRWRDPVDSLGLTDRLGTVRVDRPFGSAGAEDRVMPPTPGRSSQDTCIMPFGDVTAREDTRPRAALVDEPGASGRAMTEEGKLDGRCSEVADVAHAALAVPPLLPFGLRSKAQEIRCGAPACAQLLSCSVQIISAKHSWRLQSSQRSDDAWFVNALVPGAVLEGAYSPMTLTQGPMECAPIMCASCSAEVGWRFGRRIDNDSNKLLPYEGRYGLVQSACIMLPGCPSWPRFGEDETSESEYGCEGDEEDEQDANAWRTRVPIALLRHLFGGREPGQPSLDEILRAGAQLQPPRTPLAPPAPPSPSRPGRDVTSMSPEYPDDPRILTPASDMLDVRLSSGFDLTPSSP